MGEKDFKIGLYRRIFNKTLLEAMERRGFTQKVLSEKTQLSQVSISKIVNFKFNPSEETRLKIAVALEVPPDEIFPEKYDELYDRISPSVRRAELTVDFLRLDTPELLKLQAPETADVESLEREKVEKISQALLGLPYREKRILQMRYGLGEYSQSHTLEEVAKVMGVTRERIRQMEIKAFDRLRATPLKEFATNIPKTLEE